MPQAQASLGRQEDGSQGDMEAQEPPEHVMVGRGHQGRGEGWRFVQNQRYWGTCGWA